MKKKITIMAATALLTVPMAASADTCNYIDVQTQYIDLGKITYTECKKNNSEHTSFDFKICNLDDLCKKYKCNDSNESCKNNNNNSGENNDSIPGDTDKDNTENDKNENGNTADDISEYASEVLELVNEERAKYSLPSLSYSKELENVAYSHSKDMAENNYFSHTDLSGKSPFDRLSDNNISYKSAAENIAAGQETPEEVMNSWMNSSGHRANILNSSVTKMGIGIYEGSNQKKYWTQMFIG